MKYLLNHLSNTLVIGYLEVGKGKFAEITDSEVEEPGFIYAVRSKWASIHDTPPKELIFDDVAVVYETPAVLGTTEFPGNPEPVVEKEPEVEVKDEPVDAEVVAEPEAEAEAPKAKRKTAAKSAE